MDLLRIKGLELDCIVGVRPDEREREQRIHLDLALGMDLSAAGRSGRIALTCDYSQIATEIAALLRFRRYQLIEMATEELAAMLLAVHPAVEHVELHLDKPAALDGRARAASVEIRRTRAAYEFRSTPASYGERVEVLRTRDALLELHKMQTAGTALAPSSPEPLGAARLSAPGALLEWLIDGTLERDGEALPPHEPRRWDAGQPPPRYVSTSGATLFRCSGPAAP